MTEVGAVSLPAEAAAQRDPTPPRNAPGPTRSQRITSAMLVGAFLLMIGLPLPADWLLTRLEVPLPRFPMARVAKVSPADYLDGSAAQKLEKQALGESHLARWLMPRHSELVYRLARRPAPAAWVGRDLWLFVPARVREMRSAHWTSMVEYNASAIEQVDHFVTDHGASLLVALVPNRARVYPTRAYFGDELPPGRGAFVTDLVAELQRREVAVVDLTTALIGERERGRVVFFPDDHHWTALGAQAGAQAIFAEMPESLRELLAPTERQPRYRVRLDLQARSEHSLVRKLGFRPSGEAERQFYGAGSSVTFSGSDAKGFAGSCGTYWSTSYGRFGSPQFFANEARCPVRVLYRDGAGSGLIPVQDMRRLARARRLKRGHLIVWEIPEYHLSDGTAERPSTLAKVHAYFEGRELDGAASE